MRKQPEYWNDWSMEMIDKPSSLKPSKRLKELGVRQANGMWYWVNWGKGYELVDIFDDRLDKKLDDYCVAFTAIGLRWMLKDNWDSKYAHIALEDGVNRADYIAEILIHLIENKRIDAKRLNIK